MCLTDCLLAVVVISGVLAQKPAPSEDAVDIREDGGYGFRYRTRDQGGHYGEAVATPDNTVSGKFGYREPGSGRTLETRYTAGERGFRAQGPSIHRRMDLGQVRLPYSPPVPQDSAAYNPTYTTYYDPNEDSSYHFDFATNEYKRTETGGPRGQISGAYSYVDDVGDIHNVEFEAGSQTGYHVKTPFPDSNHNYNELYFRGDGKVPLRGRTSIQRGTDGSYRFTTHSQDQRRSEVKDALGNTRGSYTYIDRDGTQRTVQYIAGPNIGYKIVNQGLAPSLDPQFPYINSNYIPPVLLGNLESGGKRPTSGAGNQSPNKGKPRPPLPSVPPFSFGSSSSTSKPEGSGADGGHDSEEESNGDEGTNFGHGTSTSKPGASCCPVPDKTPGGHGSDASPDKESGSSLEKEGHKPSGHKGPSGGGKPNSNHDKPNKPTSSDDDFLNPSFGFPPPPHAGFPEEESAKPYDDPTFKPFTIEDNLFLQRPFSSLPPAGPDSRFFPERPEDPQDKGNSFTPRPDYIDDFRDRDVAYSEEEFRGFPPGVSVKARVQSLDINPFGTKVPAPGDVLDSYRPERSEWKSR